MPEVPNNIDMTTGTLGLTDKEENQIVAFLQTLTDGFNPANPTVSTYKNIDTFTGQCSIASPVRLQRTKVMRRSSRPWNLTQFPCAADICGVPPCPPRRFHRAGDMYGGRARPPYFSVALREQLWGSVR